MNRRGFTLLELLVVMGIMGFMGTLAVGGYRAMQRGMEDSSVLRNVSQFIRAAAQRADIDRQPVAIYFWNETLQGETASDEVPIVVGKAVAVRRSGRITAVSGRYLCDEFGDLRFNRLMLDEDEENESASGADRGQGIPLYHLNGNEGNQARKTIVSETTVRQPVSEVLSTGQQVEIECYAFVTKDGGGDWKVGDAYGFEFADITLPHGYLFGSNWSKTTTNPIAGEQVLFFRGSGNGASGRDTISISAMRPGASGAVEAKNIGTSTSPKNTQQ